MGRFTSVRSPGLSQHLKSKSGVHSASCTHIVKLSMLQANEEKLC